MDTIRGMFVYEYASGVWTQIGQDIDGEVAGDRSGYSVSLSANGKIVAIGSPHNNSGSPSTGQVRIYEYTGGVWIQVGQDIEGAYPHGKSGNSISLSADGFTVAIGIFHGSLGSGGADVPVLVQVIFWEQRLLFLQTVLLWLWEFPEHMKMV